MPYQLHCWPEAVELELELLGVELFTEELVATEELLGLDELVVATLDELGLLDETELELLLLEFPPRA